MLFYPSYSGWMGCRSCPFPRYYISKTNFTENGMIWGKKCVKSDVCRQVMCREHISPMHRPNIWKIRPIFSTFSSFQKVSHIFFFDKIKPFCCMNLKIYVSMECKWFHFSLLYFKLFFKYFFLCLFSYVLFLLLHLSFI